MCTNEVRIDDGTARFISCCTVYIICWNIITHRLLRCYRCRISIRAWITNFIWICAVTIRHTREKKDEDKWKLNDYWLGFLIIKIYINANKKKLHNAINKETTVENKFITYYNRDVTDHCWMVFVCQTLNYRERYHPELAFVLYDISPRLPPFPSAFLTFCQISRLHE